MNHSISTVYLKTDKGLSSFCIPDIMYFHIENDEVKALQIDGQIDNVHHSLSELESMFTTFDFFRIHAKSLINLLHIKHYNHKICSVTLKNEKRLIVSQKRKTELYKLLSGKIPALKTEI